ncbi:hypothetical protein [Methylotenera sp.]|uniref:hypothetical protein n=1 Tax=Methylotenera sp. TaxID=2051956 RepID=UPI002733351D|nr:hypothetical protein [Methylotenera sp.]MDP3307063.1 hypothetical protein [Methylotenera sp.]
MNKFIQLALKPKILFNGAKVSLVVGTLLNVINQWEYIVAGHDLMIDHLLMNYLVPFCVSTYSGAKALESQTKITNKLYETKVNDESNME